MSLTQNYRTTEWTRLEGTTALLDRISLLQQGHPRLRIVSRQILNISRKGDSTSSLGNLFQCSVTPRVKNFFLTFRWNFLCMSSCPLCLVPLLGTTGSSSFAQVLWFSMSLICDGDDNVMGFFVMVKWGWTFVLLWFNQNSTRRKINTKCDCKILQCWYFKNTLMQLN